MYPLDPAVLSIALAGTSGWRAARLGYVTGAVSSMGLLYWTALVVVQYGTRLFEGLLAVDTPEPFVLRTLGVVDAKRLVGRLDDGHPQGDQAVAVRRDQVDADGPGRHHGEKPAHADQVDGNPAESGDLQFAAGVQNK